MKTGKLQSVVKDGVGAAIGIAGGKIVTNKVEFLQKNPLFGAVAQLVIASIVAGSGKKGGITDGIAAGMAANAMVTFLQVTAPGLATSVGLAGLGPDSPAFLPAPSLVMPGVAGMNGLENYRVNVK